MEKDTLGLEQWEKLSLSGVKINMQLEGEPNLWSW